MRDRTKLYIAIKKYQKTPKGRAKLYASIKKYQKTSKGHVKTLFYTLRQGALRRNVSFNLKLEDFERWWFSFPDRCVYCDISLKEFLNLKKYILEYNEDKWEIARFKRFFRSSKHKKIKWLTVDRVNNSLGYLPTNIVKACWICNSLKNNFFSKDEMELFMPDLMYRLLKQVRDNLQSSQKTS